jgi:hypothetical protein
LQLTKKRLSPSKAPPGRTRGKQGQSLAHLPGIGVLLRNHHAQRLWRRERVVGKAKKPPPTIRAMIGEPIPEIRSVLKNATIVLPFLEAANISPWLRDEIKRILRVPRKKRVKAKDAEVIQEQEQADQDEEAAQANRASATSVNSVSAEVRNSIESWKAKGRTRAFGLTVQVSKTQSGKRHVVNREVALADQGSEITVIYPPPGFLTIRVWFI